MSFKLAKSFEKTKLLKLQHTDNAKRVVVCRNRQIILRTFIRFLDGTDLAIPPLPGPSPDCSAVKVSGVTILDSMIDMFEQQIQQAFKPFLA